MKQNKGERYYCTYEETILPSQVTENWLQFTPSQLKAHDSRLLGKWLIFSSSKRMDELWINFKEAVYRLQLGISIKASDKNIREAEALTCIYTQDWRAVEDIRRVLLTLRNIGISGRIYYKADDQTRLGLSGSIYCSPYGNIIEITKKGFEWHTLTKEPLPTLQADRKTIVNIRAEGS